MADIKLVLTDMDNTIAQHMAHVVTDPVRQAVIDLENRGVVVAAVTGRAYPHAKAVMNLLGVEGPCVFDGGATIVHTVSEEILWKQWLSPFIVSKIVDVLRPYCDDMIFDADYQMITVDEIDIDMIEDESPCVFAIINEPEKAEQIAEQVRQIPGLSVHIGPGVHPETGYKGTGIQITHHLADKFHGVEALRKLVDIPKENTLAIGDGDNDVPLFENAVVRVAMGNATDQLKAKADYVVATVDNDGFAEAMHKYVMQK